LERRGPWEEGKGGEVAHDRALVKTTLGKKKKREKRDLTGFGVTRGNGGGERRSRKKKSRKKEITTTPSLWISKHGEKGYPGRDHQNPTRGITQKMPKNKSRRKSPHSAKRRKNIG